jgi:membrane associated rhomboid family serine protease
MGIYYFATMVESMVGSIFTLLIFLFSVLGGSLFSIWMRRKESDYQALGASGGVLGLLLCAVMWFPEIKLGLLFIPIPIPGWIFCILFNLGSIVFSQTADRQRISHEGHLGGALFGGVIGFALLSIFAGAAHADGSITKIPFESWALFWFGVFPILLFGVVSWIRPQWLYRK